MLWANFLHIYQPPTQKPFWIHKITAESYRPVLGQLKKFPEAKLTLNVNGILLEHFRKHGESDVIETMGELMERGQLELTGSAKYHPMLPFLPESETIRQIQLNEETHREYFGDLWKPQGFFPPEMGFNHKLAEVVASLGYKWIIVDELAHSGGKTPIDYSKIYEIEGIKQLKIYFRERWMSWIILSGQVGTGHLLVQSLDQRLKKNEYLLTAMDGETFGHHRPGLDNLLFEIYQSPDLKTVLISNLPDNFSETVTVKPIPSTWALMEKDLEKKKPFARWKDEENVIHQTQWELTDLAINTLKNAPHNDPAYPVARDALDRALHSDQYWWASARPWWSIEMIERGAKGLYNSILLTPGINEKQKLHAKSLYEKIIFTAFDWQREGIVEALARAEDEEIRQRTDVGMPRLPQEEIDKMIVKLESEIGDLVKRQEFERAAQIRDRISELRRYAAKTNSPEFSAEGSAEKW